MAFTTWAAVETAFKDALASADPLAAEITMPDGTSYKARSVLEMRRYYEFVKLQVQTEAGNTGSMFNKVRFVGVR